MNISQIKGIFQTIPTFSSSTISSFRSGKSYEYPNEGAEIYPLLFLEEDFLITVTLPNQENWNIALLVLDQCDDSKSKAFKDNIRDSLLEEARNVVSYYIQQLGINYTSTVIDISYLSLLDYEQDNCQGWRIEITMKTPRGGKPDNNPNCVIYA
ncbi:hypothetical protein UFOVP648_10 [uncultured Caudovirales phage]|uniref:Uncharacterized protein n=1 Tax=uncultured Caudovirales phage TaxID=2100421 RepID=A0A6J5N6E9_9CAUD|nr:hypothetical protein UFOVP648_10 [uncultured Caudovirales phage]